MFTAKANRDGSTVYRSRVTGLRYTISSARSGTHALYREGVPTGYADTRRELLSLLERLDTIAA